MRIPLATDIKTRTGAPDKDARIKNAYVETRGDQSVVRKRPIAQGGIAVGSGVAQGGIDGFVFYGDTQYAIPSGTTWSSATNYSVGDHVTVNWKDYWALTANLSQEPTSNPEDWSSEYVPQEPALFSVGASPTGNLSYNGSINLTYSNGHGSYIGAGTVNALVISSSHSSNTFVGLVNLIKIDLYAANPNVTGDYSGEMFDAGEGVLVAVTGTWSSQTNLEGGSWDENPVYEIDGTLQDVISTSCSRPDLIPDDTIIGDMGDQGQFSAWEGSFLTHP